MALYVKTNRRNKMDILITLMIGLVASILGFAIVATIKAGSSYMYNRFKPKAPKRAPYRYSNYRGY